MPLTQELVEEINVLIHFSRGSTQEGIKVHRDADTNLVAATKRLFDKGLVTQDDGGYTTLRGREALEHVKSALDVLNSVE